MTDHKPTFFRIKLDENRNLTLVKESKEIFEINAMPDTEIYIKTLLEEVDILLKLGKHFK